MYSCHMPLVLLINSINTHVLCTHRSKDEVSVKQEHHSSEDESVLSEAVIKKLQKDFGYAIKQNINNLSGLQLAIGNIVEHNFGMHSQCGRWCKAAQVLNNTIMTLAQQVKLLSLHRTAAYVCMCVCVSRMVWTISLVCHMVVH